MTTDERGRDIVVSVSLFLLGILTRLPFRSQVLYHWDSVNFALGMEHFDVYSHQPHPPGYFLYVMLGRLVNCFAGDPNASLVWISVLATGLTAVVMFLLGRSLWGYQSGIVAALLLLSSPLFWFHGEVALSYMIEAAFVILVALLCYRHLTRKDDRIWLSALVLGLAGGFRQNTIVFLLPLWLVAAWRLRWWKVLLALITLALTCAAWFMPMVVLTGGMSRYLASVGATGQGIAEESSLFEGTQVVTNWVRLTMFICYALCIGLIPLAVGAWRWMSCHLRRWRSLVRAPQVRLFFWWIAPSLGFYLFIHIRQPGHSFTFMPAVLLLTVAAIGQVADWIGKRQCQVICTGLTVSVISANILFFLLAPSALFGSPRLLFSTPGWRSIRAQDIYVSERVDAIRDYFAPQSTAVLAEGRNFRYSDYYLRDYQHPSLSYRLGAEQTVLENTDTLILFDAGLLARVSEPALIASVPLPDGGTLNYVHCDSKGTIVASSERITCLLDTREGDLEGP